MASIRKRVTRSGRVRWVAQVRIQGAPHQTRTFDRVSDARAWAEEVQTRIRASSLTAVDPHRKVADAIDRYLDVELPELARTEQRLRRTRLEWWKERIGKLKLHELGPEHIAEWRDRLQGQPGTRNRYLAAISVVLQCAASDWRWLSANPAQLVRRRREPPGRVRYLLPDERDRLLEATRASSDARLYPLVLLALTTGARQGEFLRLRWEHVDLRNATATIEDSKNRDRRQLHLPPEAVQALEEYRRTVGPVTHTVFPGSFPRHPFDRAVRAAELNYLRFHDLRHNADARIMPSSHPVPMPVVPERDLVSA